MQAVAMLLLVAGAAAAESTALPERLSETGLFEPGSTAVRSDVLPYSPQYVLWSDGASKRRWLYLPPGTAIDAADVDAWDFPPGTRLWKEFSHGAPIETRMLERLADGSWRYAVYVWEASGRDAVLAPDAGIPALPAAGSPGGRYTILSRTDCRACHEGAAVPVLGVGALQLSPDRDPNAANAESAIDERAVDLDDLVALGLVSGLPDSVTTSPPRIRAASATARSALGYLHANCGHCHNDTGALSGPDMILMQSLKAGVDGTTRVLDSMIGRPGDLSVGQLTARLVPGHPSASLLTARMASRNPILQMPPLGTRSVDLEGVALVERWIRHELDTD
jgi:hypothetical protein